MGGGEKITRFKFDRIILEKKNLSPRLAQLVNEDAWFIVDDTKQIGNLTLIRATTGEEFMVASSSIDRFYRAGGVECSE